MPIKPVGLPLSLAEILKLTGGRLINEKAAEEKQYSGLDALTDATAEQISFLTDPKFWAGTQGAQAGVVMMTEKLEQAWRDREPGKIQEAAVGVVVPHVWPSVLLVLRHFYPEPVATGSIHPSAYVAPGAELASNVDVGPQAVVEAGAQIAPNVIIGAGAYIGEGAEIGPDSRIYPNAYLGPFVQLGARCRIGPGTCIGYEGFKTEAVDGQQKSFPQIGIVVLEDDVEIGANAAIDRASFAETRIGARTKIDNLVMIGHNCSIGSDCLIAAQAGFAGSTTMGPGCMVGGQVGVADHITIAPGTVMLGKAGIYNDLDRGIYLGNPALPRRQMMRAVSLLPRLPEIARELERLKKAVGEDCA